jgi:hypothetical protein
MKRTKLFIKEIHDCYECPHMICVAELGKWYCGFNNKRLLTSPNFNIPKWCKLEDVKKEVKQK